MTGNKKILCDVVSVIPCSIQLPDGNATMTNTEGIIVLASHLRLNYVLFVPILTCNLISVSQLIQDGLYYFRDISSIAALSSVTDRACDLWHQRLGHPSSKVV